MVEYLVKYFDNKWNISHHASELVVLTLNIILFLLAISIIYFLAKKVTQKIIHPIVRKSKNKWDDLLQQNGFFTTLPYFIAALLGRYISQIFFAYYDKFYGVLEKAIYLSVIWLLIILVNKFITTLTTISSHEKQYNAVAISSFLQLLKIVMYIVGVLLALSVLLDISLNGLFTYLGALTAVLILVFKDTILGFVAGLQVASNKSISLKDWIDIPKQDISGTVEEINLVTSKIKNWDKTISTIPTYMLISEHIKNWEGIKVENVRRIKRSLSFDMNSVRFCDEETRKKFDQIYARQIKRLGLPQEKSTLSLPTPPVITNLTAFREHVKRYLTHHPMVSNDFTLMVRQLDPTSKGIPLEIYCFLKDIKWVNYEEIQAELFDYIIASANEFELDIFQDISRTM